MLILTSFRVRVMVTSSKLSNLLSTQAVRWRLVMKNYLRPYFYTKILRAKWPCGSAGLNSARFHTNLKGLNFITFIMFAVNRNNYAMRMEVTTEHIAMNLKWHFIEEPTRINQIIMGIYWPELPEKRINSVERASHKCTISNSIKECIEVKTSVFNTDISNTKPTH